MRRGKPLLVLASAALICAGVALAGGPSSVTVLIGTQSGGDAASLAAVDGNTLDIVAAFNGSKYVTEFRAVYDAARPSLSYSASSVGGARHPLCGLYFVQSDGSSFGVGKFRLTRGRVSSGSNTYANTTATVAVYCTAARPFTLQFDLLTNS